MFKIKASAVRLTLLLSLSPLHKKFQTVVLKKELNNSRLYLNASAIFCPFFYCGAHLEFRMFTIIRKNATPIFLKAC